MSSFPLLDLPDELIIIVLEELERLSRYSLRSCTAVCHRLYRLGVPIAYRHVYIYDYCHSSEFRRGLAPGSQLPRFAASASFTDLNGRRGSPPEPLRAWLRAASSAHNLKVIRFWNPTHIAQEVLDDIDEFFPDAVIDLYPNYCRRYDNDATDWERSQSALPCDFSSRQVRSLNTRPSWNGSNESTTYVARCMENTVNACPNLERLTCSSASLSVDYSSGRSCNLKLNLDPSKRIPSLKEFAFLPLAPEAIRSWGTLAGHWRQLRRLKVNDLKQLLAFGEDLPCLKHLTIADFPSVRHDALNAFRGPHAPLESLHIQDLDEYCVPVNFICLYADTLKEVFLYVALDPISGFSDSDLSTLNRACPRIRRLCLGLQSDGQWPPSSLATLGVFECLEEVFVVCGLGSDAVTSLKFDEAYLNAFDAIRRVRNNDSLWRLGIYNNIDKDSEPFPDNGKVWETTTSRFLLGVCHKNLSDEMIITTAYRHKHDYNVHLRVKQAVSLDRRPFLRASTQCAGREHLYWAAKNLGGSDRWARSTLLPAGLLTQKDLDDAEEPSGKHAVADVRDLDGIEKWKAIIVEELEYFKRKRDFEAKHGELATLYDVLYPAVDKSPWH